MRMKAALLLTAVVLAACGGDAPSPEDDRPAGGSEDLIVQVASYDLYRGEEQRFMTGLLTPDQNFVSWGTADMSFTYLGTEASPVEEPGPHATARFLHIDGEPAGAPPESPAAGPASEGRGVYAAQVGFPEAGFWEVEVRAEVDGRPVSGTASFSVGDEPAYPAVGQPAPKSRNLLLGGGDAPRAAVDSRAIDGGEIPDPELHRTTVAEAIEAREPVLVVVSTPVYCVSRFCGPVTDMVASLADRYSDRARFVHIEVWRNFDGNVVNQAAADWVYRNEDLTEPWVFLVDAKGKITARWDNVATEQEIAPLLEELPAL